MSSFFDYIDAKGEAYSNIDIARFPNFWQKYSHLFSLPKTIQIVGTNGKGSTGRYIANFLSSKSYKTLHYTSPHILKVNERFWIDGENISDSLLQKTHLELLDLISPSDLMDLSYFEYLTLAAFKLSSKFDYFVCEAGLGGEFDATSAVAADLMVVTAIDLDHQSFLGENIESIATTKLRAIRSSAVLGKQKHPIVYEIASQIATEKNQKLTTIKSGSDGFEANKTLALTAIKELGFNATIDELPFELPFGRLTEIEKNIFIDVGHNQLAASLIADKFAGKQVVLIYNSYFDKNFFEVLQTLKPVIKRVVIYPVSSPRVAKKEEIEIALHKLQIPYERSVSFCDDEIYLVFGSFSVVEQFLRNHYEK